MSLLDEIRDRNNQPKVAPRQDVLLQTDTNGNTSDGKENENTKAAQQPTPVSDLQRLEELLAKFPEIAARIPVRLEVPIKDELDDLCNREKITLETLFEALYVTCKDEEGLVKQAIREAKKRLKGRKEPGNIRSSLTKLTNLTKKSL
jgi:hypothetical protein